MSNTVKGAGIAVAVLVVAAAAARGIRSESANGPANSSATIQTQAETSSVMAVLNRSCGDCHSNTMVSRWFTRIPPFSTIMARGAREGRKAVDFSEWAHYSSDQRRSLLRASCTDATLGKMPMKAYLHFRRDAELSTRDVETICSAARQSEATSVTSATQQSRKEP